MGTLLTRRCDISPVWQAFDRLIGWAAALPRRKAAALTLLAVGAAGLADYATGPDLWFGPVYLLVICLPAWSMGARAALLTGLACVVISILANGMGAYPLGQTAVAGNLAMRMLAVTMIIALMVGMRRSHDREWTRARCDRLTGLMNEQSFHECAAAASKGRSWGILAYIDLDGFKQINDRHGHAAGDATLRAFADEARKAMREGDAFARVGGDEFLVFLPVGGEAEGYRLATDLHARMNAVCSPHPIGCSMGALVMKLDEGRVDAATVAIADQLMYQAKREGRSIRISTIGAEGQRIAA